MTARQEAAAASSGARDARDQDEDGSGVARSSEEVAAAKTSRSGTALRGDIEGLRAIAVGTVLIYHVGITQMPGGFVGVDIFFVISGFLITSLLLRETIKTGTVSIADFYARRARRLLPAASVVLLFTGVAGWFVLPGAERATLGADVIAATFYVINWALALRSVDYLAEDAAPSALQHYWSLSVEEQYYVVWPLLIILGLVLARRTRISPKKLLFGILGVVALASLVYSVVHTVNDPATAYFYTTTRVWELAVGALLAFVVVRLRHLPRGAAEALAALGLVMIGYAAFFITESTPWPGSMALVPTLGAAAIIAAGCARQDTVVARGLSLRPMQWIGGLSYAIYLWHWPLIILAQAAWPEIRVRHLVLVGLGSIVLAWLTKHLVEDPIRFNPALSAKASRGLAFGGASMAVTAALGLVLHLAAPQLDEDAEVTGATALVADQQSEDWQVTSDPASVVTTSGEITPDPGLATQDVPLYYDDDCQIQPDDAQVDPSCTYGVEDGEQTIAMLGDSKMGQWFPAVESIAQREQWRLDLYLKSACSFSYDGVKDDCAEFGRNVVSHFEEVGAPDVVIVSQGSPESETRTAGMVEALSAVKEMGSEVVVLADNSTPTESKVYECVEENPDDYGACGYPAGEGREGRGTPALEAVAEEVGAPFVDLNEWICPPGLEQCPAVIGETLIYRQGSHVTASYVRSMTPMLHRALAEQGLTSTEVSQISVSDVP
ncbi:acyltransferase family protein [Janibacter alkaliphilus]|uniref:Peptidoglycan/LPS O-acetylase OafA/YrhL n=1 Tax=Janibacter alkaliphilus TaxID=1069963 RepID=A0A852X198_9MICO|nr:peptidoglycan/LPS O-acetylase OafA/YrhL [Janibacter alkaliphilus]